MWIQEGLLDIKPVLKEEKRRFATVLGKRWCDKLNGRGRAVRDVLCAENDIVIWWYVFFNKIGNGIADLVVLA